MTTNVNSDGALLDKSPKAVGVLTKKVANSERDNDSLAPLVKDPEDAAMADQKPRRKSWFRRLSRIEPSEGKVKTKRGSISDSGPFIFAFDPRLGKEVLMRNPHWPNEDSWKREAETEGQWAMGSMAGQQNKDFGGQIG